MPLTDKEIRSFKPKESNYKRFDSRGLFVLVTPAGGRLWRLKYSFNGKEKLLALGQYPDVSLAMARDRRDDARRLLAQGLDPGAEKERQAKAAASTFEAISREWLASFVPGMTPANAEMILDRLVKNIFPYIGRRPIHELTAQDVLAVIKRIADRGAVETARRILQYVRRVFDYAVLHGYAPFNPSVGLSRALPRPVVKHHAAITSPKAIGPLLRALDGYTGSFVVACALKLAPLLVLRPGELRHMEWQDVDMDAPDGPEIRLPAERMKMKRPHVVPLSKQAVAILESLRPLTGPDGYVFPSIRTKARPMSENSVTAALRRMGYDKTEQTGHGFRSTFSTLMHEGGWASEIIERQLAHEDRDKVRAAYSSAQHLPERRKMMQAWADFLDGLMAGGKVTPIRAKAG